MASTEAAPNLPKPIVRGFAVPGNASKYGRLAHTLGVARQWTKEEASAASRKAAALRRQQKQAADTVLGQV